MNGVAVLVDHSN